MGKFGELSGKIIVAILLPYQDVVAFWSCWLSYIRTIGCVDYRHYWDCRL